MLLLILGLTVLTYLITFTYIIKSVRDKALTEGKKTAMTVAQKKANEVKAVFDEDLAVARIMAEAIQPLTSLPDSERNQRRKVFMDNVLLRYPKYDATWMSWQLELIDENWTQNYGRERFNSYMESGEVKSSIELAETDGSKASTIYELIKGDATVKELLSEPYWYMDYDYSDNTQDSLLGISTVIRLEQNGQFAGVIGADMSVNAFKNISAVDFYESAHAVLLTNGGVITAHKDPALFNSPMDALEIFQNSVVPVKDMVKNGEEFGFTTWEDDQEVYIHMSPVPIGRTGSHWMVCTVVPVEEIMAPYNGTFSGTIIVLLIGLIVITISIRYIAISITQPLDKSTRLLEELAAGKLKGQKKLEVKGSDEISNISKSLNRLIDSLQFKIAFAQRIGGGNLEAAINVSDGDELGHALVKMQHNLKLAIGDIKSLVKASEQISDNIVKQAENIHSSAHGGYETSNSGIGMVNKMSMTMTSISSIASKTDESFKILEERSKEITKVVTVISDLTRQTNMLAVNAAIQAAKAGEAGKGFSVVANEVKKLAENSGKSAKDIDQLIKQIMNDTHLAAEMSREMTSSIRNGESATAQTSEAFQNINESVMSTVSLSESILSIAKEQIIKIKEVSENTESIVISS
ncbi:MAG: methyl-accepting chemotaxis protein [Cyclobacteriaceae bacterium]